MKKRNARYNCYLIERTTLKQLLYISFLLFSCAFISCKKSGCTNYFAENYDPEASKDDGSCILKGEMYFYFSAIATKSVPAEVELILDGISIGNLVNPGNNVFTPFFGLSYTEPESCGSSEGLSVKKEVGSHKLVVLGDNYSDTIHINNNITCDAVSINGESLLVF